MRRWSRIIVVALVLLSIASVATAQEGQVREDLERSQRDLSRAREGLDIVSEQVGDAQSRLEAADRELAAAEAELAAQHAALAAAQAEHEQARIRTTEAAQALKVVTDRLWLTKNRLETRERRFDDRISDAYKFGTVNYADALLGAEEITDVLTTFYYVRSVLESDQSIIDGIAADAQQLAVDRARAEELRDALQREEEAAEEARVAVESETAAAERLAAMVADEREQRAELLAELESTRESYEGLVGSLEAESERLAAELREIQERAAREAAARAAAEAAAAAAAGQAPPPPPPSSSGAFQWPTNGRKTSNFGWRTHPIFGTRRLHAGIDIGAPTGATIVAAAGGVVISAGWRGGYGLATVIDHGGGLATLYAHQSRVVVSPGQQVGRGQKIGEVGSTGFSTGPHLHFEVRVNGSPQDPMRWF